jgi:hypothetical protein
MTITTLKFSQADWANVATPAKAYKHLADLLAKGTKWKDAQRLSGVGYASGWLFVQRLNLPKDRLISVDPTNPQPTIDAIRHARLVEEESWGMIMARTGLPEGQVRACFTQATNVQSEGLRNGHGGRYLQGNAEAYKPAPPVGWVRPNEGATLPAEILARLLEAGAVESADVDELQGMNAKALKAFAKSLGLPINGSKQVLVARIAEAYAA